jgi:hypothetical protein
MDESTGKKDGLFNIAIGNGPFVDGLPNLKIVIFHGYVE